MKPMLKHLLGLQEALLLKNPNKVLKFKYWNKIRVGSKMQQVVFDRVLNYWRHLEIETYCEMMAWVLHIYEFICAT